MNQYRYRNDPRVQTRSDPRPQRRVEEPQRRSRFTEPLDNRAEWRDARPPYQKSEDLDGVSLTIAGDPELLRKKQMLQKLNEKILHKKASIAIKSEKVHVNAPPFPADVQQLRAPAKSCAMSAPAKSCTMSAPANSQASSVPGGSHGMQMKTCKGGPLKDRVREILLQHQFSLYSKLQSSKERLKSSTLSKEHLQQDQHPLKLRVKALRTHRLGHASVLPTNKEKVSDVPRSPPRQSVTPPVRQESSSSKGFELLLNMINKGAGPKIKETVPDVPLPPPRQSVTSPVKQESSSSKGFELLLDMLNKGAGPKIKDMAPDVPLPPPSRSVASPVKKNTAEKGFERFLSVLNKGVDISSFSSNVKEEPEIPVRVKTKSDPFLKGESLPSGSGSSSRISSTESKTGWLDRKEGHSLDSGDPTTSSLKVTKKEEEEENSDLEEKRKQLQSILKSLGLNLNMEELSKLTDRNHERVHGKKSIKKEKGVSKGKNVKKGKNVMKGKNVKKEKNVKDGSDNKKQGRCNRSTRSRGSSPYLSPSASSHSTSRSRSLSRSPFGGRSRSRNQRSRSRSRNQRSRSRSRNRRSRSRETSRDETRRRSMSSSQSRGHIGDAFPFPHSADYLYNCAQFINYCNTYSSAMNPYWFYQQNENSQLPVSSENYSDPQCSKDDYARRNPSVYPYQDFMASMATEMSGESRQYLKAIERPTSQSHLGKRKSTESSETFSNKEKATFSERKAIPGSGLSRKAQRSEERMTNFNLIAARHPNWGRGRRASSHLIDVSQLKEGRGRRSSSERSEESPVEKKMEPAEEISSKVNVLLTGVQSLDAQQSEEEKPLPEKVGASDGSSGASEAKPKSCLKIKQNPELQAYLENQKKERMENQRKERMEKERKEQMEKERKARIEEDMKTRLRTKLLDFTQKAKEMTKRQYPSINEPADSLAFELS